MLVLKFISDDQEDTLSLGVTPNNGIRLTITNGDIGGELNEFDLSEDEARKLSSALLKAIDIGKAS